LSSTFDFGVGSVIRNSIRGLENNFNGVGNIQFLILSTRTVRGLHFSISDVIKRKNTEGKSTSWDSTSVHTVLDGGFKGITRNFVISSSFSLQNFNSISTESIRVKSSTKTLFSRVGWVDTERDQRG